MRHFALMAVAELVLGALATAAPPVAPPVAPPKAPPVARPPCAKGNECCDCEKSFPLNPNPGPCKCDNCHLHCFPLGNGAAGAKDGPPAGYPAAPAGFEWRRDARGPDGWGLFQVGAAVATTSPAPVCTGRGCRLVYGALS